MIEKVSRRMGSSMEIERPGRRMSTYNAINGVYGGEVCH